MEMQQKNNKTLAAFIHHFKTPDTQCAFDNDTVAIHIFVEGLRDAPNIAAKIYEKDLQTLAEVIRLVEKLSAAHQLTATLTPFTVCMMSGDNRCFVCGCTGHFGHHCPDVQCYGCDEFGHFTQDCHCDSSIRNATPPWHISFKASIHPQPKRQIMLLLWSQT